MTTSLAQALRQKYRTPREALKALGLDENLLQETRMSKKPTKFAATALQLVATAVKPLLAKDAKIDLGPVFKDLTVKTFDKAKVKIALDSALKGKIAKDAEPNMSHVASMLDHIEHMSKPEVADESVSEPQHKAMEAAAHGESNLGIPKAVGKEFSEADKGKTFDAEPFKAFLKEKGVSDEDIEKACDMAMPKNDMESATDKDVGLDEDEEEKKKREEAEKKAADEAAAKSEEEKKKAEDAKKAEDRKAMDKMVAKDQMDAAIKKAIADTRVNERNIQKALRDVKPWVGDMAADMAFDSAEQVHRKAAEMLEAQRPFSKPVAKIATDALLDVIQSRPRLGAEDGAPAYRDAPDLALDSAGDDDFNKRFGGSHIVVAS